MFKESIQATIDAGMRRLEELKKICVSQAHESDRVIEQAKGEVQTLVTLASQVPEKVFDRYSNVLVSTIEEHAENPCGLYAEIRLGTSQVQLRGLMGNEALKRGKYRVIVLLEPLS